MVVDVARPLDKKAVVDGIDANQNIEQNNCNDNHSVTLKSKKEIRRKLSPADSLLGSDGKQDDTGSSSSDISLGDETTKLKGLDVQTDVDENNDDDECLAVHTLERDMPDFDYSHLVKELKERILLEHKQNPGLFAQSDIDKCCQDEWQFARYLLRQKLDLDNAFDMMRRSLRFKHESLANFIKSTDFPAEFYMVGGTFGYLPDRKGNRMLYIRVKVHRKIPEINGIIQGFLLYHLNKLDEEVKGRGECNCNLVSNSLVRNDLNQLTTQQRQHR